MGRSKKQKSPPKKKFLLRLISLAVVILALPLTVFLAEQSQETRKEAAPGAYNTSCSGITCGNCVCEGWPDNNDGCTGCGHTYCKRDTCGCGYSNCCYRDVFGVCVACNDLCRCGCFSKPQPPPANPPTPTATPTPCPAQVDPRNLSGSCSCASAKEGNCNCNLDWGDAPGAVKYFLRVNDTVNGWLGISCSTPQNPGDICLDNLTSSNYSFTGKGGHTYTWWVHGGNSCNNSSAGIGGPIFTAPYLPAAPTNITCTATCDSGLRFTWTDNSNNETGVDIVKDSFTTIIGNVGANVTSWDYIWCGDHNNHSYNIYPVNACGQNRAATGVTCTCSACPTSTPTLAVTGTVAPTATPAPICCPASCNLNTDCPTRIDCPAGVCDDCDISSGCYQRPTPTLTPTPSTSLRASPTPTTGAVVRACTWANISPYSSISHPVPLVINQNQNLLVGSLVGGATGGDIDHVNFSSDNSAIVSLNAGSDRNGADGFGTTARTVGVGSVRILTQIYLKPDDDIADCAGETYFSVSTGGGNAWFQSQEGDVHAQGAINVQIPPPPVTDANFSVASADNQSGIISFGGASASFGQGFPSDNAQNHWLVQANVGLNTYTFFHQLLGSPTTQTWDGSSAFSLPAAGETKILYTGSQVAHLPSITCASTGRLIILTDADAEIEQNIVVNPGCFLAVVAQGEIRIDDSVSQVQGVYVTGSTLSTGNGNLAFTGEGIFVAGNFALTRDFSDSRNDTTPVEKFIYRPDFAINSEKFWLAAHTWEEKAPRD